MNLCTELAGKHGGTVTDWTTRLAEIGVPGHQPLSALSSADRREVNRLIRAHRRPRPRTPCQETTALDYITWSRRTLARYVDHVEPWRVEGASAALQERARHMTTLRQRDVETPPVHHLDRASLPSDLPGGEPVAGHEAIALVAAMERDYAVRRIVWTLAPYSLGIGFPQRLLAALLFAGAGDDNHARIRCRALRRYRHRGVDYVRLAADTEAEDIATDEAHPTLSSDTLGGLLEGVSERPRDSPPLVLSADVENDLKHLRDRWLYRHAVGRAASARSTGVIACLSGPEGHGKRTAVRALARELNLPLYRVAPGRLASRYIGETEQRISALFERVPEESILMIDQAQDLITSRVEVRRSNDRYSNMSVNHLLTCLEDRPGLTVLVVDKTSSLDAAMQRRIAVTVHFKPPDDTHWEAIARAQWEWLRTRLHPERIDDLSDVAAWCSAGYRLSPARLLWVLMDTALHAEARALPMTQEHLTSRLQHELATMGCAVRSAIN